MKITTDKSAFTVQNFCELEKGDVFKFAFDDAVYMVIDNSGIGFNAVDLETGDLMFAEEHDDVFKVDYTFTIKD